MKILKGAENFEGWTRKVKCATGNGCGAVLEIELPDLRVEQAVPGGRIFSYTKCPICQKTIYVNFAKAATVYGMRQQIKESAGS